jgi:hypothetical protein
MNLVDTESASALIEAAVTAISVLGGTMAYFSGHAAAQAVFEEQPPEILSQLVNEGLGEGFTWGWPAAVIALIIVMWT